MACIQREPAFFQLWGSPASSKRSPSLTNLDNTWIPFIRTEAMWHRAGTLLSYRTRNTHGQSIYTAKALHVLGAVFLNPSPHLICLVNTTNELAVDSLTKCAHAASTSPSLNYHFITQERIRQQYQPTFRVTVSAHLYSLFQTVGVTSTAVFKGQNSPYSSQGMSTPSKPYRITLIWVPVLSNDLAGRLVSLPLVGSLTDATGLSSTDLQYRVRTIYANVLWYMMGLEMFSWVLWIFYGMEWYSEGSTVIKPNSYTDTLLLIHPFVIVVLSFPNLMSHRQATYVISLTRISLTYRCLQYLTITYLISLSAYRDELVYPINVYPELTAILISLRLLLYLFLTWYPKAKHIYDIHISNFICTSTLSLRKKYLHALMQLLGSNPDILTMIGSRRTQIMQDFVFQKVCTGFSIIYSTVFMQQFGFKPRMLRHFELPKAGRFAILVYRHICNRIYHDH